jgi:hypothetical protein
VECAVNSAKSPAESPSDAADDEPDEQPAPPHGGALADAVMAVTRLPLTDDEKAEAVRRLLGRRGATVTSAKDDTRGAQSGRGAGRRAAPDAAAGLTD